MPLSSLRNHRGFFSDYWLGTALSAGGSASIRLTAAQARKGLDRISRLVEAISGVTNPDLTEFRERFARPLLQEFLGFYLHENAEDPRVRPLSVTNGADVPGPPVALVLLCPDAEEIEARQGRKRLEEKL